MATRIRLGQVIVICGLPYSVVSRERGRSGESRTVYVLRRLSDGHTETRNRESLLRYL
jgi:translation elongation factor P/translation initiation factor 5A